MWLYIDPALESWLDAGAVLASLMLHKLANEAEVLTSSNNQSISTKHYD